MQFLISENINSIKAFGLLAMFFLGLACEKNFTRENEYINVDYQELEEGFKNPPAIANPKVYWWWLHGSADTVRIREELMAFKSAGISGVDIFDIGTPDHSETRSIVEAGPAFMSDEYLENIAFAVEVAGGLDIEVGLNLSSSWNAGGSWIPPEYAAKSLYFSKTNISGPGAHHIPLPFPEIRDQDESGRTINVPLNSSGRPVFNEEVAVIAVPVHEKGTYPDSNQIRNLSKYFDSNNEMLTWKAPGGNWEVYRYVVANSGREVILPSENSGGSIIDHFDAQAMEYHLNFFLDRLSTVVDDISESALSYFYLASYESRGFIWTPSLPETFKEQHGYDLYKFLPSLHIQDAYIESAYEKDETAQGFLYDFNSTISNLMITNHYQKGRSVANEAGLKLISESGGPGLPLHNAPVEALGALGALDIPRGEFWFEHSRYTQEGISFVKGDSIDLLRMVKGPTAAGNIYQRGLVEVEAFTSWRQWQTGPFDIKPVGDRAFAEGMNRVVVHGASHSPTEAGFPGIAYHAGTHYNDKRVWWPKVKPFNEYLARISHMAQQGSFYSDVLYYHGDRAPNIVRAKNADFSVAPGYDYEVINTEVLLRDLVFEEGALSLPGIGNFRLLVMDPSEQINPLVLEKLSELAGQGAIILGKKPTGKTGLGFPDWDAQWLNEKISQSWITVSDKTLSDEVLSAGKIIEGTSALNVLKTLRVKPDLKYSEQRLDGPLDYIHYRKGNLDYYFIRNTMEEWISKKVYFRQQEKIPELWDPVTGGQHSLHVYNKLEDLIEIPLTLKPFGSYFIMFAQKDEEALWDEIVNSEGNPPVYDRIKEGYVFRKPGRIRFHKDDQIRELSSTFQSFPINGEWQLEFPDKWGAPGSIVFPELMSWTESGEIGIKYFSGIASYRKTFDFPFDADTLSDAHRVYLNLGNLEKVGEAWLNGEALGISWAKPYEYDITSYFKSGENKLRIEIANVWANRIIGDARTGENFTSTNITNVRGVPWKEVPLVASGLLGPVNIELRRLAFP